jgi:hypothetical protein
MTVGLPGAGIGGLFYLASTLLLPFRSFWRRLRGRPDPVTSRQIAHSLSIALGIIGGLWFAGWLLAFVIPAGMVSGGSVVGARGSLTRTVIPVATFAAAVGTLALVLLSVEVAHRVQLIRSAAREVPERW